MTDALYQSAAKLVPDGGGGVFVSFQDSNNYETSDVDALVTRMTAAGMRAPGWPMAGVPVSATYAFDYPLAGCLNPDGSATLTIFNYNFRLCAVRVAPSGAFLPGWTPGSLIVAPGASNQEYYQACPGPSGSNFFAWEQSGMPDIWMQRINADGTVAAGWPAGGHEVSTGPGYDLTGTLPSLLADGQGGAWLATFSEISNTDADARVLHVDSLGYPCPGFPLNGRSVVSTPNVVQSIPGIALDGEGGAYVAWPDARSGAGVPDPYVLSYFDIYLQRFTADGQVAPGWPQDGLAICTAPGGQDEPRLVSDGSGGVYVTWTRGGGQGAAMHAQHVLGNGTLAPGWPVGGKSLFVDARAPDHTKICTDQRGGLFAVAEFRDSNARSSVWLQHVNAVGGYDAAWGASGLRLVDPNLPVDYGNFQLDPELVPSYPGSVIVSWDDWRDGYPQTYLSRVSVDGVVATQASLVSHAEASDHVELAWLLADAGSADVQVERRDESGAWSVQASVTPDGTGMARYDDRTVVPGTRYAYRLRWGVGNDSATSAEAWITVPFTARFALIGATPNPAERSHLRVAYSLPQRGTAQLALFDAQGRCVASHDASGEAPGAHTASFESATALRAGLYWARLTQGVSQATARVVIVD